MEKLNVSNRLGEQIDGLILKGISREKCLLLIQEYLDEKAELGIVMTSSAIAHYNSRPGHFLSNGQTSGMKSESSKNSKTSSFVLSADSIQAIEKAALFMLGNPFCSAIDCGIPEMQFKTMFYAFQAIENAGKIEFTKAAFQAIENAKQAEIENAKQAAIENAMALLIASGMKIEKNENITFRNYSAFAASLA